MPREDLTLYGTNGGELSIRINDPTDYPNYVSWMAPQDMLFGVADNTPATRRWFRNALKRLEKDAEKQKIGKRK